MNDGWDEPWNDEEPIGRYVFDDEEDGHCHWDDEWDGRDGGKWLGYDDEDDEYRDDAYGYW